jgi:hypothetical protein
VTYSGTATQTLPYSTTQHVISYLYASYNWTSCSPYEQYVLRTDAFYRYKPVGSSSWSRSDSHQVYSQPTGNLWLCY